jgi:hypothetical protein
MKPDLLDFVSVFKYEMILHTVFWKWTLLTSVIIFDLHVFLWIAENLGEGFRPNKWPLPFSICSFRSRIGSNCCSPQTHFIEIIGVAFHSE